MKNPLFRKVNTRARGVQHDLGGDYRDISPSGNEELSETRISSMHGGKHRGLDYTPLFKFLLSRVGQDWDSVFSEAVSRLDRQEPIFFLVARGEHDLNELVRVDESTYFSGLFVDSENLLQKVNPDLIAENIRPLCKCCTHTFNGTRFGS